MAEVLFEWEGRKVNLKLARATVRHLAEQHARLAAVGPTQGLRDILQWLQSARSNDQNYRALQARYATNADFPTVMDFLRAYDYEGMKRAYPKQCGSLWMATRGVLRKLTQAAESGTPVSPPSTPHIGVKEEEVASSDIEYSYSSQSSALNIKESADDVAFETLMLISNPHQLSQEDYLQISQAHQTLRTALGDLELLLRNFGGNAAAGIHGAGSSSGGGGGGGNSGGGDGSSGSPGSTPPGSPYDFYPPSSPGGSSSGGGTDGGFSPGSGGNVKGAYTWYASFLAAKGETISLENKLANLSLSSAATHADILTSKVSDNSSQRASEPTIGIQDTMSRSAFDRSR